MPDESWRSRPWGSKSDFKRLSAELAIAEREDFQSRVLPLVHALWPEALAAPPSRSFDRAGIDHLVWSDGEQLPLVVQCKGFHAGTQHLGNDQIRACRHSIRSFAASGLRTLRYVLVHNRDGRDDSFRNTVQAELDELQRGGSALRAELWDRQSLLRAAFDSMYDRIRAEIRRHNPALSPFRVETTALRSAPIEEVPLRQSLLVVDQHHLRDSTDALPTLGDPGRLLLDSATSNLKLLLGSFGMGKTTAVARAIEQAQGTVLYVPAARISGGVSGAKQFLALCLDQDELLSVFPAEDWPVLERLLPQPSNTCSRMRRPASCSFSTAWTSRHS